IKKFHGDILTVWSTDRQPRELAPAPIHQRGQRAAAQQRGEHRGRDSERQHDREAADRAGADHPQRQSRDQGGDVRVGDGREGFVETGAYGRLRRYAVAQFFADTLIDQHVGVHGDADRQNNAGDAGQRQRGAQHRQQRGQQDHVRQQHDVGYQTEDVVVQRHEYEYRQHAELECPYTLVDILLAQARADRALLNHIDRGRQRSGTQQQRQIARLGDRESRDLKLRPEYTANGRDVDYRFGGGLALDFLAVEFHLPSALLNVDHGQRFADVQARGALHRFGAAGIELDRDRRSFLARGRCRLRQLIARDHDIALEQYRRAFLALIQLAAQRRAPAPLGLPGTVLRIPQPELERRHLAEQILDLGRVLHAGQLHVDAIQPLALHDRLGYPQLVDAVHKRGAVLLQGIVLARLDLHRRQQHVDRRAAGGARGAEAQAVVDFLERGDDRGAIAARRQRHAQPVGQTALP